MGAATFAFEVRRRRKMKRWNQSQLAKAAGLSTGGIGKIERQLTTEPRGATVERLARALDCTPADLVGHPVGDVAMEDMTEERARRLLNRAAAMLQGEPLLRLGREALAAFAEELK